MRFGGHETFHIRDGWLHKGLTLLNEDATLYGSEEAADVLGVGGNMAKAIRHWMIATQLATKKGGGKGKQSAHSLTTLGKLVIERDPYLTSIATWWALHINLINQPENAATWDWFFNFFGQRRFEKGVAIEHLKRFLNHQSKARIPAAKTLDRDLSVFLNSYARSIPSEPTDPEDSKDCPLQDLGLMSFFRESGVYQVNFAEKPIPVEILGYALAMAIRDSEGQEVDVSISALESANTSCSPGKVLCLRAEAVYDLALRAESELPKSWLKVTGLAGSRQFQFRAWKPAQWLEHYYEREAQSEESWLKEQKGVLPAAA